MSQSANSTLPPINQDVFEDMLLAMEVAPIQMNLQMFLEFVFLMLLVGEYLSPGLSALQNHMAHVNRSSIWLIAVRDVPSHVRVAHWALRLNDS